MHEAVKLQDVFIHPVKGPGKVISIEDPATNQWGTAVVPKCIRYSIEYGPGDIDAVFDTDLNKLTKQ